VLAACSRQEDYDCPVLDQYPQDIDYDNPDKYLASGEQTEAGALVRSAAKEARSRAQADGGSSMDYFRAIDEVVHERLYVNTDNEQSNARDAEGVLEVGYASGCHDWAVAGAAILREMDIPVVYVDSAHRDSLEGALPEGQVKGHAFLELFDENNRDCASDAGCWLLYDVTFSKLYTGYDPLESALPGGYVTFAKGLDPWSMDIESIDEVEVCIDRFSEEYYEGTSDPGYPVTDL